MYLAYFDASGTRRNEALTMAGYVSDTKKWANFDKRWRELLKREGVEYFHMTDFASKKKEYEDWSPKRRAQFLNDLTECAWRYTNKAISATVVIEDYHTADRRYQMHESLGQPYSVCGRSCVGHVKKWASRHNVRQVAFVFEKIGATSRESAENRRESNRLDIVRKSLFNSKQPICWRGNLGIRFDNPCVMTWSLPSKRGNTY